MEMLHLRATGRNIEGNMTNSLHVKMALYITQENFYKYLKNIS